ncbi:tryptophan--tRNA ligase [Comamonas aquatica]|uniref:tryptophan--tRNA ligase n=1 Tax=Comamonas aquatica TaxID=225991 RepID=UPI002446FF5F|nr:tryptophan--tRNA ligase [Comamonas aquatica]MDH0199569.1 tryptophan--tRNA ligase [Comamonas aquatica]MDH0380454.1 tryptophan--tRNA ligase [Comamonas aquatica]MDH0428474.1 tryptophan--tRNA ligase [Comamonas aquatica]MDH0939523.1 tryptophan--tRNA ligase [Comamonas aquatica]MDH1377857.1 tryptophan--tRNA ligase [Comamonas aquatica]
MSTTRFLTGITPSGTPHLGNYAGSIRPAVAASRTAGVESFYFLADYHALIKCQDPARVHRSTLEIAASWLACGLNPEHVVFYRQSDVPEIPELNWFLTCVTGKGVLNRAHAYKASQDKNAEAGKDLDDGVTAGLFMYPVLMAADILMFNAHKVPVGRDQIQHIEMARDMASSFNHLYGEHFVLPEAAIEESVATLPGLDGRKMSKSYDNTIPLFEPREQLKKLIGSIVTDSRAPGEPKDTEGSALFQLYQAFSTPEDTAAMRQAFADGIGWGDAKQMLFERIDAELAPMRARYDDLMAHPEKVEAALQIGAERARALSRPLITTLRAAVGLRSLASQNTGAKQAKAAKAALPSFKQYRETDGKFYFKFLAADGRLLLQSTGFDQPKVAGQTIAQLQQQGATALAALGTAVQLADAISNDDVVHALHVLQEASKA